MREQQVLPSIINMSCPEMEDMTVEVMLDKTEYKEKPPKGNYLWAVINNAVAQNTESVTLPELAQLLTRGCTFAPGVFVDGKRSNDTWVRQQVFALDFDHDYTIEDFQQTCEELDIHPAFIYPSFNHTDEVHRFRAIFVADTIISDIRLRKLVQGLLMLAFTKTSTGKCVGPDKQCKDLARFFLGTNKAIIQQDFSARINPIELLQKYLNHKKAHDSSHYAECIKEIASEFGIAFRNRELGVVFDEYTSVSPEGQPGEITVGTYSIYTQTVNSPGSGYSLVQYEDIIYKIFWKQEPKSSQSTHPKCRRAADDVKPVKPDGRLTTQDKKILLEKCRLVNEFMTGERHLHHQERRILITNLQWREGGIKWFKDGLALRDDYRQDNLMEDAKRYVMKPEGCNHCTHSESCIHKTNLLQQLPILRRECRQIKPSPPRIPLSETRLRLSTAISECLLSTENKVFVIKCDTGIGKTEELLKQSLDGVCVAFDTHRLKQEAYKRLNGNGRDIYVWPAPPTLPADIETKVKRCYVLGVGNTTGLYQEALKHPDIKGDMDRENDINNYLQALSDIHSKSSVFATHEKAYQLQKNPNLHTFIFDEDFTKTMIRVDQVDIDDITRIRQMISGSENPQDKILDTHLKAILQSPSRITHINQTPQYSEPRLHGLLLAAPKSLSSPIEALFTCNAYRKDVPTAKSVENVYCITRQELREDRKFIMLSATADEEVCRMLFGERLEFIDLSGTELQGDVYCYTTPGYSKSYINKNHGKFLADVKEAVEDNLLDGIITHKQYVEGNNGVMYLMVGEDSIPVYGTFGGLQGLDGFGGKRIAVFGTPYVPEYVVKLWAAVLGMDVTEDDFDFRERAVEWNEFEVHVPVCSDDARLQRIQLWLAYSEIIQAVGRARLVNHDVDVHVFAKLPVSRSQLVN